MQRKEHLHPDVYKRQELTTEQKNNITYVLNGTTQIQSYVKQLIDVTKSWNCSDVTYTTVRLEDFFADIKEQALGLVEIYHQKIDWKAGQRDVYKRQAHLILTVLPFDIVSITG